MSVPPPRSSPQVPRDMPNLPPETPSGVFPATRDFVREAALWSTLKAVGAFVVAIAVGAVLGWRTLSSEARAQAKDEVAPIAQKQAATQAELERFQRETALRLERTEAQGTRMETKVDALLTKFNVPNPAPAPRDGGQ